MEPPGVKVNLRARGRPRNGRQRTETGPPLRGVQPENYRLAAI